MKAKKKPRRTSTEKQRKARAALRLTAKAQEEVARLLEANKAGTITQAELETRLEEVHEELEGMMRFVRASL
jgi:hypothetical protein